MTKKITISGFELNVEYADTFYKRFIGLMGRKELGDNFALLLEPCSGIHMCFMHFGIDAVFLDDDNRVVKAIKSLKPWKTSGHIKGASKVLEMPEGAILRMNISESIKLDI